MNERAIRNLTDTGARVTFVLVLLGTISPASAQWIEDPGRGWIQLSLYHHNTKRVFNSEGSIETIFADGHAVTTSLYITAAGGVLRGVDMWIQFPVHRLIFNDLAGDRRRLGTGDLRMYVRAGPALLGLASFPVAVRAGVKLPGGDFPVDAEVIPLGEGQRDWELIVELGHSFYPVPMYLMGWIGYRWREANEEVDWKPGDERFAFAAAGGQIGSFTWKVAVEGWLGRAPRTQGITIVTGRREILQLLPSLGSQLGPGTLEIGARLPLAGRNLPAGPALFIGYFMRWRL